MALDVLKNKNVDGKTWSDAAKWILLYGPPELQHIIKQASIIALSSCFPQLKPESYTESGELCYDITQIAESLGISEEDVLQRLTKMEADLGMQHLHDSLETDKIH